MFESLDEVAACVQRAWRSLRARRQGRALLLRMAAEREMARDVTAEELRRKQEAVALKMQSLFR